MLKRSIITVFTSIEFDIAFITYFFFITSFHKSQSSILSTHLSRAIRMNKQGIYSYIQGDIFEKKALTNILKNIKFN